MRIKQILNLLLISIVAIVIAYFEPMLFIYYGLAMMFFYRVSRRQFLCICMPTIAIFFIQGILHTGIHHIINTFSLSTLPIIVYFVQRKIVEHESSKYAKTISDYDSNRKRELILKSIFELSNYEQDTIVILKGILNILITYYNADSGTIFLKEGRDLACKVTSIQHYEYASINMIPAYPDFNQNLKDRIPQIIAGNGRLNYPTAYSRGIQYAFFIPFVDKGELIGALLLESSTSRNMNIEVETEFYSVVTDTIKKTLEKCLQIEKIQNKANYDPTTGLLKREPLIEYMQELSICSPSVGIVMLDLDHFKQVNDTYGHDVGDIVLVNIAHLLKENIRNGDAVGRWGGDEFVIVLNDVTEEIAFTVIDRLRDKLEKQVIHAGEVDIPFVTGSIGISMLTPGKTSEQALKEADEKAYVSKKLGRNKVTI